MLLIGSLIIKDMKKISHFFDFATTFFSLSSASLLHFSFSQSLLYFFIFILKLAKILVLETFRLVNIGKSLGGYPPKVAISYRLQNSHFRSFWFQYMGIL